MAQSHEIEYRVGGEGLFLATLSGHGAVWIQSLPFSRLADRILADRILAAAAPLPGASKGEGSVIGDLARAFER